VTSDNVPVIYIYTRKEEQNNVKSYGRISVTNCFVQY